MPLDGLDLYVLLCAVYLLECCRWVGRRTLLLRQWPLGQPAVVEPLRVAPQLDRALTFGFPFPPFGSVLECEPFPFEAGPAGLLVRSSEALAGELPTRLDRWVPWAAVTGLKAEGKEVFLGATRVAVLHNARAAAAAVERCRGWVTQPPGPTSPTVPGWSEDRQLDALRQDLARFSDGRWLPQLAGTGLWAVIFGGFGAITFATKPPSFVPVFALVALWWLICLVATVVWVRKTLPRQAWPGGGQWFLTLASPLSLLRAADLVERELLFGADAATAVVATLPPQAARDVLERWRRDLQWPIRRADLVTTEAEVLANDAWHREALLQRLARLSALLEGTTTKAITGRHCPRCLTEYLAVATACTECPGVTLVE